ncbi:MAG: DUF4065 domain-containing protein [Tannerellaceae bacterium]|jgi:uncharacterized phage-associated protein|nr:DUF4065 domain-containing protein [Tannerellaceae bacterium]
MTSVLDVANYFLCLQDIDAEDFISNLKMQKLCYYAQGFWLAIHNVRLFPNDIEAWQHGPVVPELYHKYKNNKSDRLPISEGFDQHVLSKKVTDLLEDIYQTYGQYSAWRLRDMTHQEPPWANTVKKRETIISDREMINFFKTRLA